MSYSYDLPTLLFFENTHNKNAQNENAQNETIIYILNNILFIKIYMFVFTVFIVMWYNNTQKNKKIVIEAEPIVEQIPIK